MSPPRDVLVSIARAVQKAGGDMTDVDDLVQVWERLEKNKRGRVDAMRADAKTTRCCCATAGEPADDGRCSRCYGAIA